MKENNKIIISDEQIEALSYPLIRIVSAYYEDPENEKKFQQWLKQREQQTGGQNEEQQEIRVHR